jgi:hypothetical protein
MRPSSKSTLLQIQETELIDVQVSFRVDANGVAIPMATAYVIVKSINGQPAMRLFKWGRAFQ